MSINNIVIEPILLIQNINTCGHSDNTPFTAAGDLIYVLADWWHKLPLIQRSDLRRYFGEQYGYAVRDKIINPTASTLSPAYKAFYKAYLNTYNAEHWHYCMRVDHCIAQPIATNAIANYINLHKSSGVYCALSKQPLYNDNQLTDIIHNALYGDISILLTPWQYEINSHNEFYVFIYNKKITAISQKHCYKYVGMTQHSVRIAAVRIVHMYNTIKPNIHYNNCVLHVWVNNNSAMLIKVKPGESWCDTKSALFNWANDEKVLKSGKKINIRYIDIQSPLLSNSPLSDSMPLLRLSD